MERGEAASLFPGSASVLWPGRALPLRLDPLLRYREGEFGGEVLFLNRGRKGGVEYLSYSTGRIERDSSAALETLLGRISGTQDDDDEHRAPGDRYSSAMNADAQLPAFPSEFRISRRLSASVGIATWVAEDLGRSVLVVLRPLGTRPAGLDLGAARERSLAALEGLVAIHHEHLARVHGWVRAGEHDYLVEEYLHGNSLSGLTEGERLDWRQAGGLVADVAEGLRLVHSLDIVHGNIQPSTIRLAPTLSPRDPEDHRGVLVDFSLASGLADPIPRGPLVLSPHMAPEAFQGAVTKAGDVYGLAATLFHLVTGTPPFAGRDPGEILAQIRRGISEADPRWKHFPEPLERIIREALAPDPHHRPGMTEFTGALQEEYSRLMADDMSGPSDRVGPASNGLCLVVSRMVGAGEYQPVATSLPGPSARPRHGGAVPRPPERVCLRTGDNARVEVISDRPGYFTVFNIGPSGNLDRLSPDDLTGLGQADPACAPRARVIVDVDLEPPTGR